MLHIRVYDVLDEVHVEVAGYTQDHQWTAHPGLWESLSITSFGMPDEQFCTRLGAHLLSVLQQIDHGVRPLKDYSGA